MKTLSVVVLAIAFLIPPALAAAQKPGDEVRQTVEKVMTILRNPQLKGKDSERRKELREVLYQRFDFAEMAKRSLGPNWRRRSAGEQKEFVQLFTNLLETAYLDKIESYNGEKVQYLKDAGDANEAEVDTKIVDKKGQEYSINYRLHNVNGDWKVYDVIVEDISLVNNYRSQFNHVLARSSFEELVKKMKEKEFESPRSKG